MVTNDNDNNYVYFIFMLIYKHYCDPNGLGSILMICFN
jgi:hypothetical protein